MKKKLISEIDEKQRRMDVFSRAMADLPHIQTMFREFEKNTGIQVEIIITRIDGPIDESCHTILPFKLPHIANLLEPGQSMNLTDIMLRRGGPHGKPA